MKAESKARGEGKDGEGEGATVIAHSVSPVSLFHSPLHLLRRGIQMGGLVTLHALARAADPTVFKGIIFAGTPFHGCVNVLVSSFTYGERSKLTLCLDRAHSDEATASCSIAKSALPAWSFVRFFP